MDLRRITRRRVTAPVALLAGAVASCSPTDPATFTDGAIILPATLGEAYRLAEAIAREWSPEAFPTGLGGGFTVMGAGGGARNHSFEFHAREGFAFRKLTLHLIGGSPWSVQTVVARPPPAFVDFATMVDSDVAIAIAINLAEHANSVTPDSIPVPELFAARLLSRNVWPEPRPVDGIFPVEVAWRVDFLELDTFDEIETPTYWSTARFYLDPHTGELRGEPVLPPAGPEIYPFP